MYEIITDAIANVHSTCGDIFFSGLLFGLAPRFLREF